MGPFDWYKLNVWHVTDVGENCVYVHVEIHKNTFSEFLIMSKEPTLSLRKPNIIYVHIRSQFHVLIMHLLNHVSYIS